MGVVLRVKLGRGYGQGPEKRPGAKLPAGTGQKNAAPCGGNLAGRHGVMASARGAYAHDQQHTLLDRLCCKAGAVYPILRNVDFDSLYDDRGILSIRRWVGDG
jgi:hypothetical protein